ncbi:WG repeat-containing protein [candidate division WOR-3 bacterium]|nr:WG repeat-containing protein [candidate division WOR-3 bacterium]
MHPLEAFRPDKVGLFPVVGRGRWGFCDRAGRLAIPHRFDWVDLFFGGRAVVCVDGRVGAIDARGNFLVRPEHDALERFSERRAVSRDRKLCGFVDDLGRTTVLPGFVDARDFSNGMACVNIGGRRGLIDNALGGKWGFVDWTGKVAIPARFDHAWDFSAKLAPVNSGCRHDELGYPTGGRWGLIDKNGNVVVKQTHLFIAAASEGMHEARSDRGCVYFNQEGGSVPDFPLEAVSPFCEGVGAVKHTGRWGFIDEEGVWIVDPKYGCVLDFAEGRCAVSFGPRQGRRWGFIDRNGTMLIYPQFRLPSRFRESRAVMRAESGRWGHITPDGEYITEPVFAWACAFSDGLAAVNLGGRQPDVGRVLGGKWGYIRPDGSWLVRPRFEWAGSFRDGHAEIWMGSAQDELGIPRGGRRGYIDRNGRIVWKPSR